MVCIVFLSIMVTDVTMLDSDRYDVIMPRTHVGRYAIKRMDSSASNLMCKS